MQRIILLLLGTIFSISLFSQKGTKVFHPTYESALKEAQNNQKILMLDFYTDWCKPCKKLEKQVFHHKNFRPYLDKVSCVRIDFESEEGGKIGQKYQVKNFPTVVFVSSAGTELERLNGFYPPERYFEDLERIIAKENTIGKMEARFPEKIQYRELFHLSQYFSRVYPLEEKKELYYQGLLKRDPSMEKDSTILLTNLLYQISLMRGEEGAVEGAKTFIIDHPDHPFQPELALRVCKLHIKNEQRSEAESFYSDFKEKLNEDQKAEMKSSLDRIDKLFKKKGE